MITSFAQTPKIVRHDEKRTRIDQEEIAKFQEEMQYTSPDTRDPALTGMMEPPEMNPKPSATEIEMQLRTIVAESPTEPHLNGCESPLEVYAYHLQKKIIEPLLIALAAEGIVSPLDDLGHDTGFVQAWNRALAGQPDAWDCRLLAALFINTATRNVPDLIEKIVTADLETVHNAVVVNVAHYLSGQGMPGGSARSLKSWADGTLIQVRMDAFQPILETIKGTPLESPRSLPAALDAEFDREETPFEIVGIMSFNADGIDHETGVAAWEAWRKKARLLIFTQN